MKNPLKVFIFFFISAFLLFGITNNLSQKYDERSSFFEKYAYSGLKKNSLKTPKRKIAALKGKKTPIRKKRKKILKVNTAQVNTKKYRPISLSSIKRTVKISKNSSHSSSLNTSFKSRNFSYSLRDDLYAIKVTEQTKKSYEGNITHMGFYLIKNEQARSGDLSRSMEGSPLAVYENKQTKGFAILTGAIKVTFQGGDTNARERVGQLTGLEEISSFEHIRLSIYKVVNNQRVFELKKKIEKDRAVKRAVVELIEFTREGV